MDKRNRATAAVSAPCFLPPPADGQVSLGEQTRGWECGSNTDPQILSHK